MKRLYFILMAIIGLFPGTVALSPGATTMDVVGSYELTMNKKFIVKGYGKDLWSDSDQLVLSADGRFTLGDTEGTFSLNAKGKKILLQIEEESLNSFEDGCSEMMSDLAFEKGIIIESEEIMCSIDYFNISKIKIDEKTAKGKGKIKVKIKGFAYFDIDGEPKKKKFSYKGIGKIYNERGKPNTLFSDDFSTDSTSDYTVTDTLTTGGTGQFIYDAAGQRVQVLTGDDVGLAFSQSLSPTESGSFSIDFLPTQKYPTGGVFVLILRQDADSYYRLLKSDGYGGGTLTKFVGGVAVDQLTLSNEYTQNTNYQVTVNYSPEQTTVIGFGENRTLNSDTTSIYVTSFEIRTTQQDAYYDDINLSNTDSGAPYVVITSPVSYHLQTTSDLDVEAIAGNLGTGWGVKFVLDQGTPDETVKIDKSEPYSASFRGLPLGEHTLDAFVVDETRSNVVGTNTSDSEDPIGIGDILVAIGDSITKGVFDDVSSDDESADGRNTGGGFEPILNDLMTNENNYPHTVINEGVPGARSADGAATIANTVAKYPDVTLYLVLYGTNDSSIFMPVPSGKGLNPGDAGYPGTFKDNMQQIVDAINAAGKVAALAKVPIAMADCSKCPFYSDPSASQKNAFIRDFNIVIDELVSDSGNNITIAPPDFYTYFEANYATEYSDYLHPNGMGYDSMAELWFEALAP